MKTIIFCGGHTDLSVETEPLMFSSIKQCTVPESFGIALSPRWT